MTYLPSAPVFENETFVYKLGGMHFKPDGTTIESGYFALVISDSLMKCLYNMGSVPIQAKITITHEDTSEVGTYSVSHKDGYSRVFMSGISFSNPKISVEFLKVQVPSSIEQKLPESTISKVQSIKCKNKTRVITKTGIKPICPSGYKKLQSK
jgi:hypothetical protein